MFSSTMQAAVLVLALSAQVNAFAPATSSAVLNKNHGLSRDAFALRAISIGIRRQQRVADTQKKNTQGGECPLNRWDRHASEVKHVDEPCILTIDGVDHNMTAWAKAHPGGEKSVRRFHGKDATKAFAAVGHSKEAYAMLEQFRVPSASAVNATAVALQVDTRRPRWMQKLFTKEDPVGFHKTMGIFSLLHFVFRFAQAYFQDPSVGLGTRLGKKPAVIAALCLVPHFLLSLSSLIFHTVPKERVVGKPMIWQEFRIHNIAFGLRSVVCAWLAWLSIYMGNTAPWRRVAVTGSCLTALVALMGADEATRRLRVDNGESTTATMPYWEGCSIETQRKFKTFYAYSQFLATGACLSVGNPAWALVVLLPIQLASLLMTLVRKGLLSARGYHIAYTVSLIMPYFVGFRSMAVSRSLDFPVMLAGGWTLYQLRRRGVNKYALWVPVMMARIAVGDRFINFSAW